MILLEIDPHGFAGVIVPLKRDGPRAVHMDRVPRWLALEGMEVIARHVHVAELGRGLQGVEKPEASPVMIRPHLGARPRPVKLAQALMPDASDHRGECKASLAYCQEILDEATSSAARAHAFLSLKCLGQIP